MFPKQPLFPTNSPLGDSNDTVLAFATGQGMLGKNTKPISKIGDKRLIKFRKALDEVMKDLAIQIVKDGEGATKLVQVNVRNAISISSAKKVAMSIANSPLIKTAIAGSDPNWGRIIMAIGKTKEQFRDVTPQLCTRRPLYWRRKKFRKEFLNHNVD